METWSPQLVCILELALWVSDPKRPDDGCLTTHPSPALGDLGSSEETGTITAFLLKPQLSGEVALGSLVPSLVVFEDQL